MAHIETQCLHEGYKPGNGQPKALPIYQSTTYTYDSTDHIGQLFDLTADGHMYSRISNPTVACVEEKIAAMEGGVGALCTTSGQAASLLSILNIAKAGDHFISASTIAGGRTAQGLPPEHEGGVRRDHCKPRHCGVRY